MFRIHQDINGVGIKTIKQENKIHFNLPNILTYTVNANIISQRNLTPRQNYRLSTNRTSKNNCHISDLVQELMKENDGWTVSKHTVFMLRAPTSIG